MKILDPTDERVPVRRSITRRPAELSGRVALLDISKPGGDILLDHFQQRLSAQLPNVEFRRYCKPTFAKPAPESLRRQITEECAFVIEALAD